MAEPLDHTADLAIDTQGPEPDEKGPLRRCIATGRIGPKEGFIRFVIDPAGAVVPDFDGKLPGRGLHLEPSPAAIAAALKKHAFSRAARQPVTVPDDLATRLERTVAARVLDLLGLARRAGQVVMGYDQVEPWLKHGRAALLIQAGDAAEQGRARLARLAEAAGRAAVFECLTAEELARPFGREHVVHVATAPGGLSRRLQVELARLNTLRDTPTTRTTKDRSVHSVSTDRPVTDITTDL